MTREGPGGDTGEGGEEEEEMPVKRRAIWGLRKYRRAARHTTALTDEWRLRLQHLSPVSQPHPSPNLQWRCRHPPLPTSRCRSLWGWRSIG